MVSAEPWARVGPLPPGPWAPRPPSFLESGGQEGSDRLAGKPH